MELLVGLGQECCGCRESKRMEKFRGMKNEAREDGMNRYKRCPSSLRSNLRSYSRGTNA
jgi:hypothetical protein